MNKTQREWVQGVLVIMVLGLVLGLLLCNSLPAQCLPGG
jgi:hypothetical protein